MIMTHSNNILPYPNKIIVEDLITRDGRYPLSNIHCTSPFEGVESKFREYIKSGVSGIKEFEYNQKDFIDYIYKDDFDISKIRQLDNMDNVYTLEDALSAGYDPFSYITNLLYRYGNYRKSPRVGKIYSTPTLTSEDGESTTLQELEEKDVNYVYKSNEDLEVELTELKIRFSYVFKQLYEYSNKHNMNLFSIIRNYACLVNGEIIKSIDCNVEDRPVLTLPKMLEAGRLYRSNNEEKGVIINISEANDDIYVKHNRSGGWTPFIYNSLRGTGNRDAFILIMQLDKALDRFNETAELSKEEFNNIYKLMYEFCSIAKQLRCDLTYFDFVSIPSYIDDVATPFLLSNDEYINLHENKIDIAIQNNLISADNICKYTKNEMLLENEFVKRAKDIKYGNTDIGTTIDELIISSLYTSTFYVSNNRFDMTKEHIYYKVMDDGEIELYEDMMNNRISNINEVYKNKFVITNDYLSGYMAHYFYNLVNENFYFYKQIVNTNINDIESFKTILVNSNGILDRKFNQIYEQLKSEFRFSYLNSEREFCLSPNYIQNGYLLKVFKMIRQDKGDYSNAIIRLSSLCNMLSTIYNLHSYNFYKLNIPTPDDSSFSTFYILHNMQELSDIYITIGNYSMCYEVSGSGKIYKVRNESLKMLIFAIHSYYDCYYNMIYNASQQYDYASVLNNIFNYIHECLGKNIWVEE